MASIGELFVELGFEYNDKQAKSFEKRIGSIGKAVAKIAAAAGAAAVAMGALTIANAKSAEGISDVAKAAGVNVKELNAMRQTFYEMGMSVEEADAQMINFNNALQGFDDKKLAQIKSLGVETKGRSAAEVWLDTIQALSKYEGKELSVRAGLVGIDPATVNQMLAQPHVMEQTYRAAFDNSAAEGTILSMNELMSQFKQFTYLLKQVTMQIANGFKPVVESMMKGTLDWFVSNKDSLISGLEMFAAVLKNIAVSVEWAFGVIGNLVDGFMSFFAELGTASAGGLKGIWDWMNNTDGSHGFGSRLEAQPSAGGVTNITMTNSVNGVSDPRLASDLLVNKIVKGGKRGRVYAAE